jgi:putative ATPase
MEELLSRAEVLEEKQLPLTEEARLMLYNMADGDGRYLLNLAEILLGLKFDDKLDPNALLQVLQKRAPVYDKDREGHYNLISALHKSLRGSDTDAALYWAARMLVGGEDPLHILRRLVRFAIEDIGLADPHAVIQANAAKEVYEFLGSPEGELAIFQLVIYLGTAPKSNAAYMAHKKTIKSAKETGSLNPPMHILNAPTKMMKEMGYGKGYQYDHDAKDGFSGQNYFPDELSRQHFYQPTERGFEREITKRIEYWAKLRDEKK